MGHGGRVGRGSTNFVEPLQKHPIESDPSTRKTALLAFDLRFNDRVVFGKNRSESV